METHRLKIDTAAPKERPQFSAAVWRASAVAFELGLFTSGAVLDLADVTSITLRIRKARMMESIMLEEVVAAASFTTCTAPQWAAGTHEHVRLELGSEAMNLTTGDKLATLHVTISALLSSGGTRVLGMGELVMHDANAVPGETSPSGGGTLITLEEADARFLQLSGLSWLVGATKANGKITFTDGSSLWLEAPPV